MGGIFKKEKFKHIFSSGHSMRILKYRIRRDVLIDRALTLTTPGVGDAAVMDYYNLWDKLR